MGSWFSMRTVERVATGLLLLTLTFPAFGRSIAQKKELALTQFETAERMREELNGRPIHERTRREYQRVTDAYRRVYYTAPTSVKADPAVVAVAELLAEAGRRFNDTSLLKGAIGQYEFLRREYPGSKYRVDALFTIGEIYKEELDDAEQAKASFQEFLKRYPHSQLAGDARAALKELEQADKSEKKATTSEKKASLKDTKEVKESKQKEPETPDASLSHRENGTSLVTGIRHWSTPNYTRVAIDLDASVEYQAGRVPNPDRIFFDLHNSKLASTLAGKTFEVQDGFLTKIRVSQYQKDLTRVVLDVKEVSDYSAFLLPNPYRLIIDIHGRQSTRKVPAPKPASQPVQERTQEAAVKEVPAAALSAGERQTALTPGTASQIAVPGGTSASRPEKLAAKVADGSTSPLKFDQPVKSSSAEVASQPVSEKKKNTGNGAQAKWNPASEAKSEPRPESAKTTQDGSGMTSDISKTVARLSDSEPRPAKAAGKGTARPERPESERMGTQRSAEPSKTAQSQRAGSMPAPTAAEGEQKAATLKATDAKPTPELVKAAAAASAAEPKTKKGSDEAETADTTTIAHLNPPELKSSKPTTAPTFETVAPRSTLPLSKRRAGGDNATHEARPTANGERSLIRALGLKIGKIVVDAGHGGHDTGTIGPNGLQEKDLTLDVALRLGRLLEIKLGADVIYTRDDDTFIPLETRTAIANQNEADLFISIHANSSRDPAARGVETYYLNFTSSAEALEVAARENAVSEKSIHELQDLVKKIALKEKIEESREFASDVQKSLYGGLSARSPALRNRGVKKAPFIVLIGANMPSILAEISFLSNATDERKLQTPEYRQKVAEYLYRGITRYVNGLSGVKIARR